MVKEMSAQSVSTATSVGGWSWHSLRGANVDYDQRALLRLRTVKDVYHRI